MQEPIEDSGGDDGVAEDFSPIADGPVGCDEDGALLIAARDELEEEMRSVWVDRRIIYTTNAIEALNAKLRRAIRARGHFPSDEAAAKRLYLVLSRTEKEWVMPLREWAMAKAQFAVMFGER